MKSIDDSPVTCGSRDRCQWIPEGTVDPNSGRIYVVFAQADTATSDTNIWFKSSGDGGATWSDRKKLNDDDTNLDQYFPGVSVAPNGRVDVAWHDFRNDRYYQPAATSPTSCTGTPTSPRRATAGRRGRRTSGSATAPCTRTRATRSAPATA